MLEATFSIAVVRDIVQYVTAQGIAASHLYSATGIEPTWLEDPDRQVSGEVLQRLWQAAVQLTGDADLGLHIGEAFDLSALGIAGYVLLNCATYGEVLVKLSQYTRLFSQGVSIHHHCSDGWAICDCEIIGNIKNYLLDQPRQPIESTFAALVTATRQLTGKSLPIQAVWFEHSAPEVCTEHQRIFQQTVRFSQTTNRIVFLADCLNWPIRSANAKLLSLFEDYARALLLAQTQAQTYAEQVRQAIMQQLQGEVPKIETIARRLMVSVRQLQRELQIENTTYQQLLDATRQELALQYLNNSESSIHDIAFLLGFSEPSAFHRAFKRWMGQTPRSYREGRSAR